MCEFISWVESPDSKTVFFLTDKDLQSKRGAELNKFRGNVGDYGHGDVRWFFDLKDKYGKNKECTDFSTPANFPSEIAAAIRAGLFRGMAIPKGLLRKPAYDEYERITQAAWDEYQRIRQAAWAEYERIRQKTFWDLFAVSENRNPAWRDR